MSTTKITVNLPEETIRTVKEISDSSNYNMTTVIKRAIELEKIMTDAVANGGKILIQDKNGAYTQIMIQ